MKAKKIEMYCSDKTFQAWDHLVSHSHFLLRCPATGSQSENIDIVFNYTKYIETSTVLRGLELYISKDRKELKAVTNRTGIRFEYDEKLFVIKSEQRKFFFVAHSVLIHTNTLEMFESPLQAILGIPESASEKYADKLISACLLI